MFQATRRRLALWYTTVTAILLLLFAIGFYLYVRHTLIERIDDTLNHVVEVVERSLVIEPLAETLLQTSSHRAKSHIIKPLAGQTNRGSIAVETNSYLNLSEVNALELNVLRVNVEASFRQNRRFANEDDHIDLEWFNPQGKLLWSTFSKPLEIPLHVRYPISYNPSGGANNDRGIALSRHFSQTSNNGFSDRGKTVIVQPDSYGESVLLRQLTEQVQVGQQTLGYLRVSHPWFEVTKPIQQLVVDLASGLVLVIVGVGTIGWLLSGLAIQPVQESYQRLKQFTADASHELRNPIAMIQTNVQAALVEPAVDAEIRQQLQVVERLTRRLGKLVDDLLFLARQDKGILQSTWTTVALDGVLLEVVEEQWVHAADRAIQIHLDFSQAEHDTEPTSEPFQLQGDREQLARLLTNLISNAIHYTPIGGEIHVSLYPHHGGKGERRTLEREYAKGGKQLYIVQIQDTGMGIAPEELPHIFDRFYRADPTRSHPTTEGSGLGLAIAQAIVRHHQGKIEVTSDPQRGTTFTVTLPSGH